MNKEKLNLLPNKCTLEELSEAIKKLKQVEAIINTFDENEPMYSECIRIDNELSVLGFSIEYGLCGTITDLIKIA